MGEAARSCSPSLTRLPSFCKMLQLGGVKQPPPYSGAFTAVLRRVRHLPRAPSRSPGATSSRVAGGGGLLWPEKCSGILHRLRIGDVDNATLCRAEDRWKHEKQLDGKCTMDAKKSAQHSALWCAHRWSTPIIGGTKLLGSHSHRATISEEITILWCWCAPLGLLLADLFVSRLSSDLLSTSKHGWKKYVFFTSPCD